MEVEEAQRGKWTTSVLVEDDIGGWERHDLRLISTRQ